VYSEYFDGNPANLNAWATEEPMSGRSGVEDFTLHWALQGACDSFSAWSLNGAGYAAWRPDLSYGFVDNPDTDTSPGQQVIFNKGLAYAYLLSIPINTVLIYGKDYYGEDVWAGAYGLKPIIDNLVWINKKFAYGNLTTRYVDNDVIVIERGGNGGHIGQSSGLLTCLNFNTGTGRTVTVATSFGANVRVHDYTGHHYDDLWTDGNGNLTVAIPQNVNSGGTSFCCFSKAGVNEGITKSTRYTLQTFFGAKDLPLGQATSAKMLVGLVNSEASPTLISQTNSRVIVSFTPVAVSLPTTLWGVWVQSATTDLEDFEVVIKYKGVNPWKN
jgi:alpha-amylase